MNIASAVCVREAEKYAVCCGTDEYELMLRAGRGAVRVIEEFFPVRKRCVVLCGSGNNGGDALAVAARLSGEVIVYALKPLCKLKGAAAQAAADLPEHIQVVSCEKLPPDAMLPGDLIIDGILGIGFSGGALRQSAAEYIRAANESNCRIVALDVPSGLNCDTGESELCIQADLTVTFGAVKQGLLCGRGPGVCGVLRYVDIGLHIPDGNLFAFSWEDALKILPRVPSDVHKNSRGSLMIAAGCREYSGAAALAAHAALRCGAGVVRLATAGARANLPFAVIVREFEDVCGRMRGDFWSDCSDWITASNALAAGPGWGCAAPEILAGALAFPGPVILDADALNIAARNPGLWKVRDNMVITPHPGEAKRLAEAFGICESERTALALALAEKLGCVVLLKGKFTIVASPAGRAAVILSGSSSLATAGSGDVLTGVIGALLAAGVTPFEAAMLGASLHGRAGEIAGAGMIADDLPLILRDLLRESR